MHVCFHSPLFFPSPLVIRKSPLQCTCISEDVIFSGCSFLVVFEQAIRKLREFATLRARECQLHGLLPICQDFSSSQAGGGAALKLDVRITELQVLKLEG